MPTTRETVLANWDHAQVEIRDRGDFNIAYDPEDFEDEGNCPGPYFIQSLSKVIGGESILVLRPVRNPEYWLSIHLDTSDCRSDDAERLNAFALMVYCQDAAEITHNLGHSIFIIDPNENYLPQGDNYVVYCDISGVFTSA